MSKKKSKVVIEDLFGDDGFLEQDLIEYEPAPAAKVELKKVASTPATPTVEKFSITKQEGLSPEKLARRFKATVKYMEPRIVRKPSVARLLVRKRAFLTLLDLARSEEHIRKIMELIPRFRDARGDIHPDFAVDFTRKSLSLIFIDNTWSHV